LAGGFAAQIGIANFTVSRPWKYFANIPLIIGANTSFLEAGGWNLEPGNKKALRTFISWRRA